MRRATVLVTKPHQEPRITTQDVISDLLCRVDTEMHDVPKHAQANLYPSELVTLALLFALNGVGPRACYRWLTRNYPPVFADLPERTGLFRLFATHRTWADEFLADPTLRGGADSSGIERVHPMRQGRSARHIGCKGTSNQRWIVGVTRAYIVNHHGVVVAWDGAAANVYAAVVHPVIADFPHDMVVFTDMGVHATRGDPLNMQACARNTGNVRMVVETVVAMRTRVCYLKTISQRRWPYVLARLRCTLALCNVLVQWHGVPVDEDGTIRLSMAPFSV